jgi:hypothetical protein
MADKSQTSETSERQISVDVNAADPKKAVTRRESADIAQGVRDDADTDKPRTKAEKELFKRMGRFERNIERQFDQKLAARDAEHQRELSALRERYERLNVDRGGTADAGDAAHDAAIGALKDKLAAAYEKGDSQASADITLQISKLDAQFWAKKAQAAGVATRESAATDTAQRPNQEQTRLSPAQQGRQDKGPTNAGARFIKANDDWWDDPEFEVEKAAANTIFLRLVNQEGFDAKDDETYKEVAKQLKAKFPKLEASSGRRGPDEDEEGEESHTETRQVRRAAAARIDDRGESGSRNRGTPRALTKQEIQTMKDCRLDPDNDEHVVRFVNEILSMEATS